MTENEDTADSLDALIAGHSNMDLDCLGSMALTSCLFPGHRPVKSRLLHPAVQEALTVYDDELPMLSIRDIKGAAPESLIVVDTRSKGRVREVFEALSAAPLSISIYDHHHDDTADIPGARLYESEYGAESSHLALLCMEKGVRLTSAIATVALAGIYADTGNFNHNSTTPGDFRAAIWLIEQGASLKMVRRFLRPLREPHQADLFHLILGNLTWRRFHGHEVALSRVELPSQERGVSEVVDRVFADEPVDALIVLISIKDREHQLLIGRSRKERLNLLELLETFGGRGHVGAASALVKDGRDRWAELLSCLETIPADALTAADLMSRDVKSLSVRAKVLDASILFENTGYSGAPVLDEKGVLVGMFSLKDVSKARKAGAMTAPVSAYMSRRIVSCAPGDTIREVERRMLGENVGHLPVLKGAALVGLITRGDYKKLYS